MKYYLKKKKNYSCNNAGFIFIDLLLAMSISVIIISVVFSYVSLFTFYYTMRKDQLIVYEIISEVSSIAHKKQLSEIIKKENKEFYLDYVIENIEHTPLFGVATLPLLSIKVHWDNFYGQKIHTTVKVLHEGK